MPANVHPLTVTLCGLLLLMALGVYQLLLGHRSVTTTERHYAKWVKGRQDRVDALVSATWTKPLTRS
jgi:integrase